MSLLPHVRRGGAFRADKDPALKRQSCRLLIWSMPKTFAPNTASVSRKSSSDASILVLSLSANYIEQVRPVSQRQSPQLSRAV